MTVREIQAFLREMYPARGANAMPRSSRIGVGPGRTPFHSSRFRRTCGKVLYTTNPLESVHARVRKILKTRGHFPTDAAAIKLLWLALRNITATWGKEANFWSHARNQFAISYGDRFLAPAS